MTKTWGITVVMLLAASLAGCAGNQNAQPCQNFEKSYNAFASSLKDQASGKTKDPATLKAFLAVMRDSADQGSRDGGGDVASAMRKVASNATLDLAGNNDAGVAMFLGANDIAAACKASGAGITLSSVK